VQLVDTASPPLDLPPRLLCAIAIDYATSATFGATFGATFAELEEPQPGERTFERVMRAESHDIWVIRWAVGSRTELHDHGGSAGALYVVEGALVEHQPDAAATQFSQRLELRESQYRSMSPSHVHAVANESATTATSVHVYSPPLATMQHFEKGNDSQLRRLHREVVEPAAFAGTFAHDGTSANR
jgi:predicted metal-dependent enzyme (double-stranded beta helix superfamily)